MQLFAKQEVQKGEKVISGQHLNGSAGGLCGMEWDLALCPLKVDPALLCCSLQTSLLCASSHSFQPK
jgi:hypothetical protein